MGKTNKYIGWVALAIALIALGVSLFQVKNKEYDSMMFAVAMLSALVTILIGWNIYTLFDMKSFKKDLSIELSKQREEYLNWIQKTNIGNIRVNTSLMISMFMAFNKDNEKIKDFIYLDYGIKAIHGHILLDNITSAQRTIDELISKIPDTPPIIIEQKVALLSQLKEVEELLDSKREGGVQNLQTLKNLVVDMNVF